MLVHVLRDAVGTTDDTRDQAMWALGNIAGDSSGCRDLVLQEAGLTSLVAQLMESSRVSTLRQGTWALSNFCRGKPPPAFHAVSPAIPCVVHLLSTCEDAEVLSDVCWTNTKWLLPAPACGWLNEKSGLSVRSCAFSS
eukprot:COSAG06_NODE_27914_length_584_cov_0.802062_1_plen_138_part_00